MILKITHHMLRQPRHVIGEDAFAEMYLSDLLHHRAFLLFLLFLKNFCFNSLIYGSVSKHIFGFLLALLYHLFSIIW